MDDLGAGEHPGDGRYEAVLAPDDTFMIFDSDAGVPVVAGATLLGGLSAREANAVMEALSRGRRTFLSDRFAVGRRGG